MHRNAAFCASFGAFRAPICVRFARFVLVTSFVFNEFLASFPRFCVFSSRRRGNPCGCPGTATRAAPTTAPLPSGSGRGGSRTAPTASSVADVGTGTPWRAPTSKTPDRSTTPCLLLIPGGEYSSNLLAYQVGMKKWETVRKLRIFIFSSMESRGWRGEELSHCEKSTPDCGILTHTCRKLHIWPRGSRAGDVGCVPRSGTPWVAVGETYGN